MPQNNLKHQLMKKLILLILILMSGMMPTWAQSAAADDIAQLQKEMYQLYNKNDETGSEGWRRTHILQGMVKSGPLLCQPSAAQ